MTADYEHFFTICYYLVPRLRNDLCRVGRQTLHTHTLLPCAPMKRRSRVLLNRRLSMCVSVYRADWILTTFGLELESYFRTFYDKIAIT